MVDIFYTYFNNQLPADNYNKYLERLPLEMQKKNKAYRFWQDKHAHLFGKLLLLECFNQYGLSASELSNIRYNYYNRPYLPHSSFDFNISHSGNYVICAISRELKVGIDIETIKPVDFNEFTEVMNEDQWKHIVNNENSKEIFFQYWAIKESVIKADSRGLSLPLKEITIDFSQNKVHCQSHTWFFKKLEIDKSIAAYLTTDKELSSYQLNYTNFYSL